MGQPVVENDPNTGQHRITKNLAHVGEQVGLYGIAPIGQGGAVTDASGGATIDAEARTAINDLLARIRAIGIITT